MADVKTRVRTKSSAKINAKSENNGFSFAILDPEPISDKRQVWSYFNFGFNGRYYEPPIPTKIIADLVNIAPHHKSPLLQKRDMVVDRFIPHPLFSRSQFAAAVYNKLIFGNYFIEKLPNRLGGVMGLKTSPSNQTRVGKNGDFYFIGEDFKEHKFETGGVFHGKDYAVDQEIYGEPEYWSALQTMLLHENGIIFRRRYFVNGSFAGYILALGDPKLTEEQTKQLEETIKGTRGKGNFKNILLTMPGGKADDVKMIPIAEVGAKDIFPEIMSLTAKNMLVAHRMPPQLVGVVPETAGGFGDVRTAHDAFQATVISPLCKDFLEINDWLGIEVVRFNDFERLAPMSGGANQK